MELGPRIGAPSAKYARHTTRRLTTGIISACVSTEFFTSSTLNAPKGRPNLRNILSSQNHAHLQER